jgi:hypothetical protein
VPPRRKKKEYALTLPSPIRMGEGVLLDGVSCPGPALGSDPG